MRGPLLVEVVEVRRVLPHQGPQLSSMSQVAFPGSPPHLRLEVDRVEAARHNKTIEQPLRKPLTMLLADAT